MRRHAGVGRKAHGCVGLVKSLHGAGRLYPASQGSHEHPDQPLCQAAPQAAPCQVTAAALQRPPGLAGVADTPTALLQSLGSPLLASSVRKGGEHSTVPIPRLTIPFPRKTANQRDEHERNTTRTVLP